MLQILTSVYDGSHLALPYVEYHQVRSFPLESVGHEPLNLDGEMKGTTPLAAEVLPAALRVFGARRNLGRKPGGTGPVVGGLFT